jgi:predicted transcriptional regulator
MPDSALEYLAGSPVRPATLTAFRDQGRLSLRDLDDRVSASRRTLKRTLRAMESRGWVHASDGAYEFTALGACILSAYEEFRDCERIADRLRPFLEHTPATAFDLDIDALTDADVVEPVDDPTAFADKLLDIRAGADRLREYAPFLLLDSVRQLATRVDDGPPAPDVTLVVRTDAPPRSSSEYADRFATLVEAPSADVRRNPDGPMLGFGIADGHAFLGVADENGMPTVLLAGESADLVEWVESRFEAVRAAAESIDPA